MERAEFEALVTRMEGLAAEQPAAYRRRVFALAALGYGYLLFVVIALLVLCGLAAASVVYLKGIGVKLVLVVGALLFAVLRSLWVKQEPPEGDRVTASEAPQLFRLIDELQRRLQTPTVHIVLVTPDFNAAVTQVPRLGPFGWHRNFLLLGLPLMKGLSVVQFKSVLAHELGHLSGGHARAANWIYRMRVIWARLETTFERRPHWGSGIVRHFFKWYIPYFNAISFPFARANEYEADAASVQLTSARNTAQALTNVHMIGSYLRQTYWPAIHAAARDSPQPAFAPYSEFATQAISEVPKSDLDRWQDAALNQVTSLIDTHPSLGDRLRAIGRPPEYAPPVAGESADRLLGSALATLETTFDLRWKGRIAESWRKYHEETQVKRMRLSTLRTGMPTPLNEECSLELAALEEEVGAGTAAVLPLLRETIARFPGSKRARFSLARNLLLADEEDGVASMEGIIAEEPTYLLAGSEILRDYFGHRGDRVAGQKWHDRHVDEALRLQQVQKERRRVFLSDRFSPHDLDPQVVSGLIGQLSRVKGIKRAYLVRKVDTKSPAQPLYLLGVKSTGFLQLHSSKRAAQVIEVIRERVNFPGDTIIINVDAHMYKFARKMRRVKRAKLV